MTTQQMCNSEALKTRGTDPLQNSIFDTVTDIWILYVFIQMHIQYRAVVCFLQWIAGTYPPHPAFFLFSVL